MSIQVRIEDPASRTASVVCSPVLEAILSLSVLAQPSHHPLHHEWVRRTRRRLPRVIKQKIADFRFTHMDYIPDGLLPPADAGVADFDAELDRIRQLPLSSQARPILRNITGGGIDEDSDLDPAKLEELIDQSAELGSATVELVHLGVERPQELVDGFLAGLVHYWEVAFREDWESFRSRIAATVEEAQELIGSEGVIAMLRTLRPRIGVNEESGEFVIRREHEEAIELAADDELLFVPSAFLWPHIGLAHDRAGRLAVLYPAPFAAFDSPPDVLDNGFVPLMRALGDPTRLRALKLISDRPRSTQELAKLIAISEPAMSKHLHQLADCGVLQTRRDGYYRLYSLDRGRLEQLSAMVLEFLESD